jgi:hypothetical protein
MSTSESTPTHLPWATLCKSRLYPSVRGFGFGLWALPVKVMLCQTIIMATRFSGRGRIQRKTWCIGWDPMPELTITSAYVNSNTSTMGNRKCPYARVDPNSMSESVMVFGFGLRLPDLRYRTVYCTYQ